jgi:hypothetical protein
MPITNVIQNASETIIGVVKIATNAEVLAGADDSKAASPLKVKQYNDAKNLGIGQTWQDLTASRAANTTYTNSTGRPIYVVVSNVLPTSATWNFTINGVVYGVNGTATAQVRFCHCFIIPNGATYSSNYAGAPWSELR